jgi:hypothetical protein
MSTVDTGSHQSTLHFDESSIECLDAYHLLETG